MFARGGPLSPSRRGVLTAFLANGNVPLASIRLLRDAGQEVASVLEESPGVNDREVLRRAQDEDRILLTFDRDYGEMIYRQRTYVPSGVVYFRFLPGTPEEPARILLALLKSESVSLPGRFTVVERGQVRQRKLSKRT